MRAMRAIRRTISRAEESGDWLATSEYWVHRKKAHSSMRRPNPGELADKRLHYFQIPEHKAFMRHKASLFTRASRRCFFLCPHNGPNVTLYSFDRQPLKTRENTFLNCCLYWKQRRILNW